MNKEGESIGLPILGVVAPQDEQRSDKTSERLAKKRRRSSIPGAAGRFL